MKNQKTTADTEKAQSQEFDRKLRSMPDKQLQELTPLWHEIYKSDPSSRQKRVAWACLRRESLRRGLKV